METEGSRPAHSLCARALTLAGPMLTWGLWAAMTVGMILFIRHYNRNIPYLDDFGLVSVMARQEPASIQWAWSQHNEHRPVISRLILAGLSRFVQNDFRTGRYFNVGLLSTAAASMLLLARRLRGSNSVADTVFPLLILNIGQTESLMITFAMNLILSTWISFALITTTVLANRRSAWSTALRFGLLLVFLPLCGGSGLVMLPALMLWLAGYVACAWWSGRVPGGACRAIGVGMLITCLAIVMLYFKNYDKPSHHPPAPSLAAAASTTLEFLSTAVCPNRPQYWMPGGIFVVVLVATTLLRLTIVCVQAPDERPRALGLIAIVVALLGMATAIGLSRSGFGPGTALASRYITLTAPLFGVVYIAWLIYGPRQVRSAVHSVLLATVCLAAPTNIAFGVHYGREVCASERRVERSLRAKIPAADLLRRACPAIYPDAKMAYEYFKMLKAGGFGQFRSFNDDGVASVPEASPTVRR
jgi:hypothetical protein